MVVRQQSHIEVTCDQVIQAKKKVNLLQFQAGNSEERSVQNKILTTLTGFVAASLMVFMLISWANIRDIQQQTKAIWQANETIIKQVSPRLSKKRVGLIRALKSELSNYDTQEVEQQSVSVLSALDALAQSKRSHPFDLLDINYNAKSATWVLVVIGSNAAQLEKVRASIASIGFKVQLESTTTTADNQAQGRMRVSK